MKDSDTGGEPTAGTAESPPADDSSGEPVARPDGGQEVEYLDAEINIFSPSTPFMRDHLRIIWSGFVAWLLIVFGPVTLTAIVPGVMTTPIPAIGFPLHYFLVAIGAPGGALLLSLWYARKRDALDEQYGIEHEPANEPDADVATAADGGTAE
jgi:putative solute:sodium symporter small subunit